MIHIYSLVIWLISISGCNTNYEPVDHIIYNSDEEKIIGTWNWVRTTGGIAGVDITPQSTGNTAKNVFNDTKVESFVNDSLVYSLNYRLGYDITILSLDSMSVLYIGDNQVFAYHFDDVNTLFLSENLVDGFNLEYKRKLK